MAEDKTAYWRDVWLRAINNMPVRPVQGGRGSKTLLQRLLGYNHLDPKGRNCAAQHTLTAALYGYAPRDKNRAQLLEQLAGPHGTTIAKAVAAKRNIKI